MNLSTKNPFYSGIKILVAIMLLFTANAIYSYDLPPFTFKKGVLLLKSYSLYNDYEFDNSSMFIIGAKEQFGLSDNFNLFGKQPFFVSKGIKSKKNTGIGDMMQGFLWRWYHPSWGNLLFIGKLKVPTGIYKNYDTKTELPLGSGSWDIHYALMGNFRHRAIEARAYSSYIQEFSSTDNKSATRDFLSLCGHFNLFSKKCVLLETYVFQYDITSKTTNTMLANELLIKFDKKFFTKIGYYKPLADSHSVKSDYQLFWEFYYFTKI